MSKSARKRALQSILDQLRGAHPEIGFIREFHDCGDDYLIVNIANSAFVNVGVQKVIAHFIEFLVERRLLGLVGCDGAIGDVDTNWLGGIGDQRLKSQITGSLLESGKLTGLEYCHANTTTPFVLLGCEDETLYRQSAALWEELTPLRNFLDVDKTESRIRQAMNIPEFRPLFEKFAEWVELERRRAVAIIDNLLARLHAMGDQTAALVCTGNLPQYVAVDLERRGISSAVVDPTKAVPDDKEAWERIFSEQRRILMSRNS